MNLSEAKSVNCKKNLRQLENYLFLFKMIFLNYLLLVSYANKNYKLKIIKKIEHAYVFLLRTHISFINWICYESVNNYWLILLFQKLRFIYYKYKLISSDIEAVKSDNCGKIVRKEHGSVKTILKKDTEDKNPVDKSNTFTNILDKLTCKFCNNEQTNSSRKTSSQIIN